MIYLDDFNEKNEESKNYEFVDFVKKSEIERNVRKYVYGLPLLSEDFGQIKKIKDLVPILKENKQNTDELATANSHMSGVRIRFISDSSRIAVKCRLTRIWAYHKMNLYNSHGFDIYQLNGEKYVHRTVTGPVQGKAIFFDVIDLAPNMVTEIYLPSYVSIIDLSLGFIRGKNLQAAPPYRIKKPIAFYGHSMTQGASASRSGNIYPNIVSRYLGADIVNYSFSGACKGEKNMAKQIAETDMSAMVIDYTRNAASFEEFEARYPEFYSIIRNKYPDIPIILMGGFGINIRFDKFIYDFCRNQIKIYPSTFYLSCREMLDEAEIEFITMDSTHYNDMGMFFIAKKIINILSERIM